MPVLSPSGQIQFQIKDLENEVMFKLENRGTSFDLARIDIWLRDAILEISGNPDYRDDFDDLEEFGPQFNLTGGPVGTAVQEYSFNNFIPAGDYNLSTLDVLLWTDFPTNTVRKKLQPSHYQDTDKSTNQPSIPAQWYRFADTLGFDPPPNQNYQVQIRLLHRHPINDAALNLTVILLPREWNEVLVWSAVIRGFMELLQFEKAAEVRTMLHGDPLHPEKPGLIYSIKKRRGREAWREQQSLRPIIHGSCWGQQ